jgi:hypothetical protein
MHDRPAQKRAESKQDRECRQGKRPITADQGFNIDWVAPWDFYFHRLRRRPRWHWLGGRSHLEILAERLHFDQQGADGAL